MAITYKLELNSKPKIDGTCLIMLRITENRKPKRISTGVFVKAQHFNKIASQGNWIRKSNPKHEVINNELIKFIDDIQKSKLALSKKNVDVSPEAIIHEHKDNTSESLISFWKSELAEVLKGKSYNFYANAKSKLNNLNEFLNGKDLLFSKVDYSFLEKYSAFLKDRKCSHNTVVTNLKMIRIFYYRGVKMKKLELYNPFKDYSLKEIKSIKIALSKAEVKILKELDLTMNPNQYHARNCFLFSMNCAGLRISEALQLKWSNIVGDFLIFKQGKNEKYKKVFLVKDAKAILNLCRTNDIKSTDYIFPILNKFQNNNSKSNVDIKIQIGKKIQSKTSSTNYYLKQIAKLAGINKNLTTHINRHSFTSISRDNEVSPYELQKLLGHSSLKQTENYLAELDETQAQDAIIKAMEY